jgi:hypothetical protein
MLPLKFFVEWDRAKSARRELVEAFLSSSWPPTDLLFAAINAGAEQAILMRLSRFPRGQQYVNQIELDSQRLAPSLQSRVAESLSNFYANPTSEWD